MESTAATAEGTTEDMEVLQTNVQLLMKEMESGSDTFEPEDIKQFQFEAMMSFKTKGSLYTFLTDAKNKHGIKGLRDALQNDLNNWKDVQLNIGITGASGTGKSSLINMLRGIRPKHPNAAKVGVTETTLGPTPYPHPKHSNVVYWDLPGVGTLNFKKNDYVESTCLHNYDLFIIVGCSRFTENDAWLASEVFKQDKKIFIVRTKIDIDMYNESTDFEESFDERLVLERIKQSTEENMEKLADDLNIKKGIIRRIPIFLISTKLAHVKKYDFEEFQRTMTYALPEIKKDVMVMALSAITLSAIDEKIAIFIKRFEKVLVACEIALCIPFTYPLVISFLKSEMNFYKEQLGIDNTSLRQLNIDPERLGFDTDANPGEKSIPTPHTVFALDTGCSAKLLLSFRRCAIRVHDHLNRNLVS